MLSAAGGGETDLRARDPSPVEADAKTCVHYVDGADRVIYVSDHWRALAERDGQAGLSAARVLGKPLWQFIDGQETRYLYMLIMTRVRFTQAACALRFRCDTPELKQLAEMRVSPLPGEAVQFTCRLLKNEPRPPVQLLAARWGPGPGAVKLCSFCKRALNGVGEWIDAAAYPLGGKPLSAVHIQHAVCPQCLAALNRSLRLHAKLAEWEPSAADY